MHKIHGPGFIVMHRSCATLAQLGFHPALGRFIPEWQPYLLVKTIDPLRIDIPALALQQHMNAPVAIAHARFSQSV